MTGKRRVLFVCIGNACRSQMAEAFAAKLGSDVMEIVSAGLSPASGIPRETRTVMSEKGLSLDGQFPKSIDEVEPHRFDYILNMSGVELHGLEPAKVLNWTVRDPYGPDLDVHRSVRAVVEELVTRLAADLREGKEPGHAGATAAIPVWRKLLKSRRQD